MCPLPLSASITLCPAPLASQDGQYKKTASNKKLMGLRPDYVFTSMKDGVKKACDWFVSNYETARK